MAKFGTGAKPPLGTKLLEEIDATLTFCQGLIVQIDDLEAILYAELKPKLMGSRSTNSTMRLFSNIV